MDDRIAAGGAGCGEGGGGGHRGCDLICRHDRVEAEAKLAAFVAKWAEDASKLATWAEENVPEGFAVFDLGLTTSQRLRLRTSNSIENLNQQVKRRTRVVRIFSNEAALLRLASAVLMEISEEWESGKRYLPRDDA